MAKNTGEVILAELIEKDIPPEAATLIRTEGYHLTREIKDLKITNRDQYEKGCELGIANASILKRLEALREAVLQPLKLEIKRINDAFETAKDFFESNDEKIRKGLASYQNHREVEGIKTVHTELGRATIQERSTFEVLNPDLVPREYLKVDETKIGRVVRAGLVQDIPGVRIFKTLTTAFTAE